MQSSAFALGAFFRLTLFHVARLAGLKGWDWSITKGSSNGLVASASSSAFISQYGFFIISSDGDTVASPGSSEGVHELRIPSHRGPGQRSLAGSDRAACGAHGERRQHVREFRGKGARQHWPLNKKTKPAQMTGLATHESPSSQSPADPLAGSLTQRVKVSRAKTDCVIFADRRDHNIAAHRASRLTADRRR